MSVLTKLDNGLRGVAGRFVVHSDTARYSNGIVVLRSSGPFVSEPMAHAQMYYLGEEFIDLSGPLVHGHAYTSGFTSDECPAYFLFEPISDSSGKLSACVSYAYSSRSRSWKMVEQLKAYPLKTCNPVVPVPAGYLAPPIPPDVFVKITSDRSVNTPSDQNGLTFY